MNSVNLINLIIIKSCLAFLLFLSPPVSCCLACWFTVAVSASCLVSIFLLYLLDNKYCYLHNDIWVAHQLAPPDNNILKLMATNCHRR